VNFAAVTDGRAADYSRRLWRKALAQIEAGEMPPADAKPLPEADRVTLVRWLKAMEAQAASPIRDPGPALTRRLSRPEYNRTIRDLLNIEFEAGEVVGLPDESQGHGFSNQIGVLDLAPALMEKYFAAADIALERALGPVGAKEPQRAVAPKPPSVEEPRPPEPKLVGKGPLRVQYKCAGAKAADNQLRPHVQIMNDSREVVPLRELTLRYWFTADGAMEFQHWCDYAKVDAKNVTRSVKNLEKPVRDADSYLEVGFAGATLEAGSGSGEIQLRLAKHDWMPFDQANDYSFDAGRTAFADTARITLYRNGKLIWGTEPTGVPADPKAVPDPPIPTIVAPMKKTSRDALLFTKPGDGVTPRQAAGKNIEAFAQRAWRRPVRKAEIDALLAVYDRAVGKGADFTEAVRPALKAVLVSPYFLFRVERRPEHDNSPYHKVSDHELAVRLSYFLWSSLPDAELAKLADEHKLSDPTELERQTRRMLADPKARAITENFGIPWLQLGSLSIARPTAEFYPGYTPSLKEAMYRETVLFFDALRQEDRSLMELLDADYTYVNEELARHYGLPGVTGPEMRRVTLRPEDHRGGVLGMGSVLTLTSHTYRTSPTLRGKYVLEVILGTPPPPPPANAGVLKDEVKGKPPKTFRESIARHASVAACAACHGKIDPLGFGLENYDGVGRWRPSNADLDTSGELPGGEKFAGPAQLKSILLKRDDQFRRNLAEQMLAYALGRPVEECDESAVAEVQTALQQDKMRFSALVVAVVKSFPFQHRRQEGTNP